jgi:hypothetical protein
MTDLFSMDISPSRTIFIQQAADLSQQAKAIQQAIGCIGAMLGQTSSLLLPLMH